MYEEEHKYKYVLDDVTYFVVLTDEERRLFEDRYKVSLVLWE